MLVARKPWWDGKEANRNVSTVRVVKRRVTERKHRTQTHYLMVLSLIVFIGFLYIGLSFQGRSIDMRLSQMQNQIGTLELENEQLATLSSQYSSFRRLEQVATTELGLVKPSAEQIIPAKY